MTQVLSLLLWFLTQTMHENAPCLSGQIMFTRQGQVDSFKIRNPGCDQINGDLIISGPNITNLDSLSVIKSINGQLFVTGTNNLKNLNGLSGMQSVTGLLELNSVKQITSLNGLQNLVSLSGGLNITNNDSLRDISALNQVNASFLFFVNIINCPKLAVCNNNFICNHLAAGATIVFDKNAPGCNNRFQVMKSCNPSDPCPLGIINLNKQADITVFAQTFPLCTHLPGSMIISSLGDTITNLSSLPKIKTIGGSLAITNNAFLTGMQGLDSIQSVGNELFIRYNPRFKNLAGLGGLRHLENRMGINNNDSLLNISALSGIDPDDVGTLEIFNNPVLSTCANDFICAYLATNEDAPFSTIFGNALGCSSLLDIQHICLPGACPPGDLTFKTQHDIDFFPSWFPNCTEVQGSLNIFFSVKNLDSLYKLKSVDGGLNISLTDSLKSLKGLSGLKSIGIQTGEEDFAGQFFITDNKMLNSLDGLDSITFIAREININRNDSLRDIDVFNKIPLSSEHNAIYLYDNPVLSVCNVSSICSFLDSEGNAGISNNAPGCATVLQVIKSCHPDLLCPPGDVSLISQQEIEDFAQYFPECAQLSGSLSIHPEEGPIVSLEPLIKLKSILGNLGIYSTDIPDFKGLDSLYQVKGAVHIDYNNRLKSLDGLSSLELINSFYIYQNDSLSSLNGLDFNPDSLNYLSIENSPMLSDCSLDPVCAYLSKPFASFNIVGNAQGCSSGFQIILECGNECPPGKVQFYTQTDLNEFGAVFANCEIIYGDLLIGPSDDQDPIISLAPLSKLKSITGDLDIETNSRLKSLTGLDSLRAIGGHLQIGINDSLINLMGLGSLKSLSGQLLIQSNSHMTSLTGLGEGQIDSITSLVIEDNPVLSLCGIPPICNYLTNVNIPLLFQNNATGCNTLAQLRAACGIIVCGETDITLSNQADVDQFPRNYPGCDRLLQGLFISGANITNLDSLRQIKHIGFYLIVTANPALTRITGLSNLQTVGGELDISNNPLLQSTQGLSSLKSINGYFGIYTNYNLSSLGTIDQLDFNTITEMYIQENQKLSICNIPPICSFINDPDNADVTYVNGNNIGCETPNQIKSSCGLSTCPTGNITLTTQQEVNQFRSLLADCTILPGDLTITGTNITYLDSLSVLSGIHGQLRIENTGLTGLYGLDEILASSITHLVIKNNPSLAACEVRSVCDYISIPSKTYEISGNAPTCSSVNAITAACGKTCFREGLIFTTQAQVNAFTSNAAACESIPGAVYIDGSGIISLDSLYKIKFIGGALTIANTSLTSLRGLGSLQRVGSLLDIRNNASLTNLDALQNLTQSGATIRVSSNASLTSINGLRRIKKVNFNLIIQSNALLTNLSGLDSVESIVNNLQIVSNASLNSTAALRSLSRINNDLRIESNNLLTEVDGFESLKFIGFDMRILNNAQLNRLRSFTSLDSVRNLLRIEGNNEMDSVVGFTSLDFIGRGLRIRNNNSLRNIKSFSQLTKLVQELTIFNNDALTSLQGLDQIDPTLLTQVTIQSSDLLNLCNVKSICNYLAITPARTANISGNLMGCNSKSEILANCSNIFPVSLVSFKAYSSTRKNILQWKTASEHLLDFYQVEHSRDGIRFDPIGNVQSRLTVGNEYQLKTYELTHPNPSNGLNYYRLKMVDQDGQYNYSDIASLRNGERLQLFPNPTRNRVYIQGLDDNPVKAVLRDIMGRVLFETRVSNGEAIDLTNQSSGIYILSIESGNQPSVFRVVRE